ncbi:ribonuclease HII [Candidatus Binatia bacterium]|jgi:ribonuclease HII|nr:ribonuclease HII [Candidatus Binatia bacterium]
MRADMKGRGGKLQRKWKRDRERKLFTERALWGAGFALVAGVDEVGMGPLAGPVIAAAVVLPVDISVDGVADSKTVPKAKRETLADQIAASALGIGIGMVDVDEIDAINIYQAGLLAMRRAVEALPVAPNHLLIDSRRIPDCTIQQTCVDDGDATVYSIAAASIVAKVHRDRLMRELDERYPGYGFAAHAGYATAAHLSALKSLGPSPVHRRSFAPVRALLPAV